MLCIASVSSCTVADAERYGLQGMIIIISVFLQRSGPWQVTGVYVCMRAGCTGLLAMAGCTGLVLYVLMLS
jgi:hypothetical protein